MSEAQGEQSDQTSAGDEEEAPETKVRRFHQPRANGGWPWLSSVTVNKWHLMSDVSFSFPFLLSSR